MLAARIRSMRCGIGGIVSLSMYSIWKREGMYIRIYMYIRSSLVKYRDLVFEDLLIQICLSQIENWQTWFKNFRLK